MTKDKAVMKALTLDRPEQGIQGVTITPHPGDQPFRYGYVRAGDINFDSYQRAEVPKTVHRIATNWNVSALMEITVNIRPDGSIWALDGRQRIAGTIKSPAGPDFMMWARIYEGLSLEVEAEKFAYLNTDRTVPNAAARFRAWYLADRPDVVELVELLNKLGIPHHWSGKGRTGVFVSWETLHQISARHGGDHARMVMEMIHTIWPGDSYALEASMLRGFSAFVRKYSTNPYYNRQRVEERLKRKSPAKILIDAAAVSRRDNKKRMSQEVCRLLAESHDSGLYSKRLIPRDED